MGTKSILLMIAAFGILSACDEATNSTAAKTVSSNFLASSQPSCTEKFWENLQTKSQAERSKILKIEAGKVKGKLCPASFSTGNIPLSQAFGIDRSIFLEATLNGFDVVSPDTIFTILNGDISAANKKGVSRSNVEKHRAAYQRLMNHVKSKVPRKYAETAARGLVYASIVDKSGYFVQDLLKRGADPNVVVGFVQAGYQIKSSPLLSAVRVDNVAGTQILMSAGASPSQSFTTSSKTGQVFTASPIRRALTDENPSKADEIVSGGRVRIGESPKEREQRENPTPSRVEPFAPRQGNTTVEPFGAPSSGCSEPAIAGAIRRITQDGKSRIARTSGVAAQSRIELDVLTKSRAIYVDAQNKCGQNHAGIIRFIDQNISTIRGRLARL